MTPFARLSFLGFLVFLHISVLPAQDKDILKTIRTINSTKDNLLATERLDSIYKKVKLSDSEKVFLLQRLVRRTMDIPRYDEAMLLAYKGMELAAAQKLDSTYAYLLKLVGTIQYYNSKNEEALITFKKGAAFSKEHNLLDLEASNYNNIGGLCVDLKRYDEAEKYLKLSIKTSVLPPSLRNKLFSYRLLASAYSEKKEFQKAESIFSFVHKEATPLKDTVLICANLTYHARLLGQLGKYKQAVEKTEEALRLMRLFGDKNTLVGVMANHANNLTVVGNHEKASTLRKEIIGLKAEAYKEENQKQINELDTKYKVKELEQAKELADANTQLESKQRQLWLFTSIGIIIVSALGFVVNSVTSKRKRAEVEIENQKQRVEAIFNAEEKERTRIAKDLHDGIVQDLTSIKQDVLMLSKNSALTDKTNFEELLVNLDKTSKEVREISYQMMPITLKELGLLRALTELLGRNLSKLDIEYHFNHFGIEERLPEKYEVSIYRICQELVGNSMKHSQATSISLVLMNKHQALSLTYEDNGVGFDVDAITKGIGLTSLSSRVEFLGGSLQIDSSATGTATYIRIPLRK